MTLVSDCWHRFCPGTKEEFAHFIGLPLKALQSITWDKLAEQVQKEFGCASLGGGGRMDQFTFKFRLPRQPIHWKRGLPPGGAYLDEACEGHDYVQGVGNTLNHAAVAAMIGFWELPYRRAMDHNPKKHRKK